MTDQDQQIAELALRHHREVDGEYGCPGLSCPGAQRLIAFAGQVLALSEARGDAREGCINCGEAHDGGYMGGVGSDEGQIGPFCSQCWAMLRETFAPPSALDPIPGEGNSKG